MRFLFVDGHYYLYRSFFAIRGLKGPNGQPTNAIYAFVKALRKMIADLQPTHGAVFWDAGLPDHRVKLLPSYKQQRPAMPPDLVQQENPIMELCPHLGLQSISVPNTEADDLIASYTCSVHPEEVVIGTNDKDILQLASGRVKIYSTTKQDLAAAGARAGSYALLGEKEVLEKWGVSAEKIGDVLSLTGDTADNIPGVPGVGEKTARNLLQAVTCVEDLLAHPEKIANPALRDKVLSHADLILTNKAMVQLQTRLPLPLPPDELMFQPNLLELTNVLRECGFKSLLAEVEKEAGISRHLASPQVEKITQTELF